MKHMEVEKIFKLTLDRQFQISETISSKELEIAVYMYMTLSESVILKKKKKISSYKLVDSKGK